MKRENAVRVGGNWKKRNSERKSMGNEQKNEGVGNRKSRGGNSGRGEISVDELETCNLGNFEGKCLKKKKENSRNRNGRSSDIEHRNSNAKDRGNRGMGRSGQEKDRGSDRTGRGSQEKDRGGDRTGRGSQEKDRGGEIKGRSSHVKDRGNEIKGRSGHVKNRSGKVRDKSNEITGRNDAVKNAVKNRKTNENQSKCPVFKQCGGCQYLDIPYEEQLKIKQVRMEKLLSKFCFVHKIIGMENPYFYRNKVHAVFGHSKGTVISGVYQANSHILVPVERCFIEDRKADEIIGTIRGMLKSFKIITYNEDNGYGLLRHVLVRRGFATGEIMVVLVTVSPIFPSKNNFVKALRLKHPEITTIIQNVNDRNTSMVLGDKEKTLYGKGYIEDVLCGCTFRISSKSFYQVNPVQTEVLYKKAIEAAGLTGTETLIDAYCGIGTIGIIAGKHAKQVIGVELNQDAVADAVVNAKRNHIQNVQFYCNDAGRFMINMASRGEQADVVFMDPPRSGSTEEFIDSVVKLKAGKVVYVSCGPESLARDLELFEQKGYRAKEGWLVDLFPFTGHVETCVLLSHKNS